MVSLYNYTIFFSNRFRNSMQTYFASGPIQTQAHSRTHTQLVKPFSKWCFEKSRAKKVWRRRWWWWWLNFYGVSCLLSHRLVVELLRCVLPSLPQVWWLHFYGVSCPLSHGLVVELLWCVLPSLPRVGG